MGTRVREIGGKEHGGAGYGVSQHKTEADRGMFRMAENDRLAAQGKASWNLHDGLDVRLCLRGLQSGAPAEPIGSVALIPGLKCLCLLKNRLCTSYDQQHELCPLSLGHQLGHRVQTNQSFLSLLLERAD